MLFKVKPPVRRDKKVAAQQIGEYLRARKQKKPKET